MESANKADPYPASYDWKGTRFIWRPSMETRAHFAFDLERLDTPEPESSFCPALSPTDSLRAWTRMEVLAKLAHEPVLTRLRWESLIVPPIEEPYRSGVCHLHTGFWADRQAVFTCGYRLT